MNEATYVILPSTRSEITRHVDEGKALLDALLGATVETKDDEDNISLAMNAAHQNVQKLDALRLVAGKPARDAQKEINAYFKPAIDVWSAAKKQAAKLLMETARAREKALAEAAQAVAEGVPAVMSLIPAAPPGTAYRQELVIYVTDRSKVPDEYWLHEIDLSKVRAAWERGESVPGTQTEVITKVRVGR